MSRPSPRARAARLLSQWESSREQVDGLLREALAEMPGEAARDRHFLQNLVYGVLRHRSGLDFLIDRLASRDLDPATRNLLRLGMYQILHLRVADHAAVNECVGLAGRARSMVNAVLRRFLRERGKWLAELEAQPLWIRESHPEFLVGRWSERFGVETTRELLRLNNTPPELTVRVNGLAPGSRERIEAEVVARPVPDSSGMLRVESLPARALAAGDCYHQDPATLTACRLLDARPGERVLDACAAPGGKASALAEAMGNTGELVVADSNPQRIALLGRNLSALGVANVTMVLVDWLRAPGCGEDARAALESAPFDRILVDVPCSNTGVLRRRVDARWRLGPGDFLKMPGIQARIISRVLPLLRPGGVLVHSTCSIEPEENEGVVERVVAANPDLIIEGMVTRLPWEHGFDGAFAARLRRAGGPDTSGPGAV